MTPKETSLADVLLLAKKATAAPRATQKIGEILVDEDLIDWEQLATALREQSSTTVTRRRLGEVVTDMGFTSELDVAKAVAEHLGLHVVDLARITTEAADVRRLPRRIAERYGVLPIGTHPSGGIVIATADPTNVLALDDVRLHTGAKEVFMVVATQSGIKEHLRRAWSLNASSETVQLASASLSVEVQESDEIEPTDAPVVRVVNEILADADRMHASDVHIEPQRGTTRIRYRVDGLLREVTQLPRNLGSVVVSRIKIMSGLDIAQRREPQDGRARINVNGHSLDTRVSTLPSLHGEKVVLRLLSRGDSVPPLEKIGFEPDQLAAFQRIMHLPQGLILITGPTGSGKTNTLYAAIAESSTPEKNVVTLEDPIEVQLPGITQVQVEAKAGLTFESGLRSILRQDPDTILVGEVRDAQTAELALKASVTGHLVFTTLHTNSAAGALTRLVDMGVEPFLVASSLSASVAQRLVRRPCPACIEPYLPEEGILHALNLTRAQLLEATPRHGSGCGQCGGSGYSGRTGIFELLEVDSAMRQVLLDNPTEGAVVRQAQRAGMRTLRQQALAKALAGQTTFEEVLRVTSDDGGSKHTAVDDDAAPDVTTVPCGECSAPLAPTWHVCPFCGQPVAASTRGWSSPSRSATAVRPSRGRQGPSVRGWSPPTKRATNQSTGDAASTPVPIAQTQPGLTFEDAEGTSLLAHALARAKGSA